MPDPGYLIAVIAMAATITLALRAAPFVLLARLRSSPTIAHLGHHLPAGVMLILVVYLLRDLPVTHPDAAVARLVPVAVTVAIQLWRRNALLSITTGTATYTLAVAILPGS